jgi:hypothetical protein
MGTAATMAWALTLDLYGQLKIARTASNQEIERAYRSLVVVHHPDKGGSIDEFLKIDAARTILLNRDLRLEYDLYFEPVHTHMEAPTSYLYEPMPTTVVDLTVMQLLTFLRPPKRSDPDVKILAGKHRLALAGLANLPGLVVQFEPCMKGFAQMMRGRGTSSFTSMFKELSWGGYDWVNNRGVDYGNIQYKSWLYACCLSSTSYYEMLLACSTEFPTLHPLHTDTQAALLNQGDIVESLYAFCRGDDIMNLRNVHDNKTWRQIYTDASACFHAIDYLRCFLHGRRLKRTGDVVRCSRITPRFPTVLDDTSVVLGSIAFTLGQQLFL